MQVKIYKAFEMKSIAVAMSGGVDSAVAAALLLDQGYEVHGVILHLWHEDAENPAALEPMVQAQKIADQLHIPLTVWDAQERFRQQVVLPFVNAYVTGGTPSPCVRCNQVVKWQAMLAYADAHGLDGIATGHYAQLHTDGQGKVHLLKGKDAGKDQAYMLAFLGQAELSRSLFPVGGYSKQEIREMARGLNLDVAEREDSQDLCFLANSDYRSFVQKSAPDKVRVGEIVNQAGEVLGQHQGLPFYTIGQRKGLGIAAPEPLYVQAKDLVHNRLIVGVKAELGQRALRVGQMNWIQGEPPGKTFRAEIKIRYRAVPVWGVVRWEEAQKVQVTLDEEVMDITPGQVAVIYDGDEVLGGGIILKQDHISTRTEVL